MTLSRRHSSTDRGKAPLDRGGKAMFLIGPASLGFASVGKAMRSPPSTGASTPSPIGAAPSAVSSIWEAAQLARDVEVEM